jgi:hypothetical protein
VSTWCCGSSCCRYLSWRQDKWRDCREWRSTPFYPLLYIQIYETSSVGSLAPFLPDSEHVQLYTFINISTHSVCGRNIEVSENCKVKIVIWLSHGYSHGSSDSDTKQRNEFNFEDLCYTTEVTGNENIRFVTHLFGQFSEEKET